jgi:hypothetical protein
MIHVSSLLQRGVDERSFVMCKELLKILKFKTSISDNNRALLMHLTIHKTLLGEMRGSLHPTSSMMSRLWTLNRNILVLESGRQRSFYIITRLYRLESRPRNCTPVFFMMLPSSSRSMRVSPPHQSTDRHMNISPRTLKAERMPKSER